MTELLNKPLSSYVDHPCLNGLINSYGENLERMQYYEKCIVVATITTYFAQFHAGSILEENLSDAYWENNILYHIADWTPVSVRRHFDELGQLDEEKLLKLCEFLVADLITNEEVSDDKSNPHDCQPLL